jgi:23S rRNA pseudouridine2605 synthase
LTSGLPQAAVNEGVRLQRVLAGAGVGSRRACEELIAQGRVSVDGQVVREQGLRVDPQQAVVLVDGLRVVTDPRLAYLAVHKPRGMLTTMSDPRGRPCVGDLLEERVGRLFHVGRLDQDTEGLIFLTNDGGLAHRLTHPSFAIPKTYLAEVRGPIRRGLGRQLRAGVPLDDGPAAVDRFRVLEGAGARVLVEVVVHEGRNRLVRRLLAAVGHPVERLVRVAIGSVVLGDLRPGRTRSLTATEVASLYTLAGLVKETIDQ